MADTVTITITEVAETVTINVSQYNVPVPEAENDFIVSSAALGWIRRTLAQVKTILGLGSAAYAETTDFVSSTPVAFQAAVFSDPVIIDMSDYKDWILTVTGDTTIEIANSVDGDAGMIAVIIDVTGGYTILMGASWIKGTGTLSSDASAYNIISWRNVGGTVIYVITLME